MFLRTDAESIPYCSRCRVLPQEIALGLTVQDCGVEVVVLRQERFVVCKRRGAVWRFTRRLLPDKGTKGGYLS
jgi:hypothetical protein